MSIIIPINNTYNIIPLKFKLIDCLRIFYSVLISKFDDL